MITPAQCRAARAILGWSQAVVAAGVFVSRSSIAMFETGRETLHPSHVEAIERLLVKQGIEFTADGFVRKREMAS